MRVIVFFDLPTGTKKERRDAAQFRKKLLDDGYFMLQYSVYTRLCGGMDSADDAVRRLKNIAPTKGSIRSMVVTEKQYTAMEIIVGCRKSGEKPSKELQLSFL